MNLTELNLFFVRGMLLPINPRAWEAFLGRARYAKSPEKYRELRQVWQQNNPEKVRGYVLAHSQARRDDPEESKAVRREYRQNNSEKCKIATRTWLQNNPERVRKRNREWKRKRQSEDVKYRLLCYLRTRTYDALKSGSKSARTRNLLGMEVPELKIYLQGQFLPGMTWENYGPVWHVDHIRPCASFDLTDPAQQRECFNWSNCQPLFAIDNLRKGDYFPS